MSLSLLLPIGLAALAALLLPLLIHLSRRSEPKPVVFAALRWLQARPQPRRRHRFEEILLLVLRLLLLAALALLLAEPVLTGLPDRTPWVVVAPGVDATAARREVGLPEAQWHRLAPGFPVIDADTRQGQGQGQAQVRATASSLSSLLREVDATLPADTPLTVLVPAVLTGTDAERPVLSRPVDWRIMPGEAPAAAAPHGSVEIPALAVRHAPERTAALRYLLAVGAAWRAMDKAETPLPAPSFPRRRDLSGSRTAAPSSDSVLQQAADAESLPSGKSLDSRLRGNDEQEQPALVTIALASEPLADDRNHLVWLAPGPLPHSIREWIKAGGTALLAADTTAPGLEHATVAWRDATGPLAHGARLGDGRILRLRHPLTPARMPILLEPDFPEQLRRLLVDAPPPSPSWVDARAHAPRTGLPAWPQAARPLAPWLAMLAALLFLLERWVASGPRRVAAA